MARMQVGNGISVGSSPNHTNANRGSHDSKQQSLQPQQQQQQQSAGANVAFPFSAGQMTSQQQQQLQSLLSMPLSSFPHMLQQLPMLAAGMQPFPQSGLPFPLQLPSLGPSSIAPSGGLGGAELSGGGVRGGGELDASLLSSRTVKVSAQSNPKTVAGSISHTSRHSAPPTLLATGVDAVNQAVKAIAIAPRLSGERQSGAQRQE